MFNSPLTYSMFAILENLVYSKPMQKNTLYFYVFHVHEYPAGYAIPGTSAHYLLSETLVSLAFI